MCKMFFNLEFLKKQIPAFAGLQTLRELADIYGNGLMIKCRMVKKTVRIEMKTSSALKQSRQSLLCGKTHVCSFQVYPHSFLI